MEKIAELKANDGPKSTEGVGPAHDSLELPSGEPHLAVDVEDAEPCSCHHNVEKDTGKGEPVGHVVLPHSDSHEQDDHE